MLLIIREEDEDVRDDGDDDESAAVSFSLFFEPSLSEEDGPLGFLMDGERQILCFIVYNFIKSCFYLINSSFLLLVCIGWCGLWVVDCGLRLRSFHFLWIMRWGG